MVEGTRSDSENVEKSSSDEPENCKEGGEEGVTEYEKQRLSRIRENKARLEALGLPGIASSLLGSAEKKKQAKRKGKRKKDEDDDEYRPTDVEARVSSSSEDDEEEEEEEEEDEEEEDLQVRIHGSRRGSVRKGKNIPSLNSKKNKKKGPVQKSLSESDFIDDDEALQQAISLSLGSSSEVSGAVPCQPPPQSSRTEVTDTDRSERKGTNLVKGNDGRRKRRKTNISRVQMTEDQVIIHFFQFDEAGKGKISKRDLQRVAMAHDFGWTDKEMADMIHCFDSNGDGKLSLEDFRKIVYRCNMVQGHESSSTV